MQWHQEEKIMGMGGKVLFISNKDISKPKGPSVNEREFVLSFSKAIGDRLHCLISRPARPLKEMAGVETTFFAPENVRDPVAFLLHNVDLYRKATRILDSGGYELIVCRPGLFPVGLWLLARRYPQQLVIRHLGGFPKEFNLLHRGVKHAVGRMSGPLNSLIYRGLVRNVLAVDACTPQHVEGITNNLSLETEKILLVENATNTARFRPGARREARERLGLSRYHPIVGYAGGDASSRGGRALFDLAPRLVEKYPHIGFVIVGSGEGLTTLIRQVEAAGLDGHFVFAGLVDYERVPEYVRTFDVGVNLPQRKKIRKTGDSAQKIRQYIATGIPVVASASGNGFVETQDLGTLVDPEEPEEIRRALERWLDLSELERKDHERRAVAFARDELSVEKTLQERMRFWYERIGQRPSCAN